MFEVEGVRFGPMWVCRPLARRLWSQYLWGPLLILSRVRLRVFVRCETVTT